MASELESPEPLSPLADALVALERTRDLPSAEVSARLLSRLEETLNLPAPAATVDMPPVEPGLPSAGRFVSASLTRGVLLFALGAASGGIAVRALIAPQVEVRIVEVPAPAPVPPAPEAALTKDDASPAPAAPPPAPALPRQRAAQKPRPTLPAPSTLNHERALLDRARTALARRDASSALEALELHGTDYPKGQLREEREALRVHVLMLLGKPEEARGAFSSFRSEYPQSPLIEPLGRIIGDVP